MQKKQNRIMAKRIIDVGMTVLLLFLMAYQVTGEVAHEWIGMGMTILVIVHQILNRRWYGAAFRGSYNAYRILSTAINVALLASFSLTAFCGMSMSGHAVPFLYGMAKISFARRMHLSMSHWAFVLMGVHLGLHVPVMTAKWVRTDRLKTMLSVVFCCTAGFGLFLFLQNGMPDYLLFRVPFAFLDYEKPAVMVLLENILMLVFWAYLGAQSAGLCRKSQKCRTERKHPLLPLLFIMAAVILGLILHMYSANYEQSFGDASWSIPQEIAAEGAAESIPQKKADEGMTESTLQESAADVEEIHDLQKKEEPFTDGSDSDAAVQEEQGMDIPAPQKLTEIQDGFLLIDGGSFLMGSPESENWRIDDETQHTVTVASFYIDACETTQEEYERIMGINPSTFLGNTLPVENISWLDAIQFANAKSADAGLTPVYTVTDEGVSWDMSADGYRLSTEAEWEYACRAGTLTPFNTEKSPDATEANFYGHYPYEIEENYFDDSGLEARPGEYRQKTVEIASFQPNAWGLYDCHGNVNEWCWDYYGEYDTEAEENPTGADMGTRHVYRGGGWNDFAKNMRSAYRAAGQADMTSYNLGVSLVRNAESDREGIVTATEVIPTAQTEGRILIAYFSWSGNTRGIAQEIQQQTGADIFEIVPARPYSTDYNTVLMEAQEDQHIQARPELTGHIDNMEEYDTVILGYPNWWASIPMPIASFLEEYDFSGKRIIPFCSHGGGRFGQSLTAIAKLAPESDMGEGLSVHYSGDDTLADDVAAWLYDNGI